MPPTSYASHNNATTNLALSLGRSDRVVVVVGLMIYLLTGEAVNSNTDPLPTRLIRTVLDKENIDLGMKGKPEDSLPNSKDFFHRTGKSAGKHQ